MTGYWLLSQAHTTVQHCLTGLACLAYAVMFRDIAQEVRD
jgi:hypothetical protein